MVGTWEEYTEEYKAELEAKAKKRAEAEAKRQAELEAERKAKEEQLEAERKAREAEEEARKALSQFVGTVGDKMDEVLLFDHTAWWTQPSFRGYGETVMYLHCFRDEAGNLLTWRTQKDLHWVVDEERDIWATPEKGDKLHVKGTIKEHHEYKGEKQTALTRCKVDIA